MRSTHLLIGAGLLLAAGTADARTRLTPEAELSKALAGRVAGEPVNCIPFRSITSSQVIDKTAILYRSGGTVYVNRPRSGAESLDDDSILVTRTSQSSLCSIDIVNLVDRGSRFNRGFVSLGEFVPYRKVK